MSRFVRVLLSALAALLLAAQAAAASGRRLHSVQEPTLKSEKCCDDLPFTNKWGNPLVCADSRWPGQDCVNAATFSQAQAVCDGVGARLCTYDELQGRETKGTGCFFDYLPTWSSTPCEGGHIRSFGLDGGYPVCTQEFSRAAVRCCGDVCPSPMVDSR